LAGRLEPFQWEAGGTAEAPLHLVGTDFGFIADDGRIGDFLAIVFVRLVRLT